ncbi:MAG: hypothetical protein U1F61_26635 [Opitutaceae bacterium]
MNITFFCYVIYSLVSLALTIWVARTLHQNGRIFLVQAFRGNEALADSVNHLLVVGFYLINVGFIAFALRYGTKPTNAQEAFEFVSTKLGVVLLVLGGMHFFNVFNFDKMRRKGLRPLGGEATPAPGRTVTF